MRFFLAQGRSDTRKRSQLPHFPEGLRMKRVYCLVPLAALAFALAGCQQGKEPAATPSESSAAAPDAKPGLSLTGGQLALPAVKGNPGAAYFRLTNNGAKPAVIAAVDVAGAGMAMMHQNTMSDGKTTMGMMESPEIKQGATLVFAPGGNHVMVDDVPDDWKPGATAEITVTFSDGDKLSAPLTVVAPGSAN